MLIRALCFCYLSAVASLAIANDLYTAYLPVAERSSHLSNEQLGAAVEQVLEKLSAKTDVSLPAQNFDQDKWLRAYDFAPRYGRMLLEVQLQPDAVSQLLQKLNLQAWKVQRPQWLVWLAQADQQQAQLIGAEQAGALQIAALQRGLPLLWPVLDIDDVRTVNPEVLRLAQLDILQTASQRYDASGLLGLYVFPQTEGWEARWYLQGNGEKAHGRVVQASLDQLYPAVLEAVLARLTEAELPALPVATPNQVSAASLISAPAEMNTAPNETTAGINTFSTEPAAAEPVLGEDGSLQFLVRGINGFADYVKVQEYLSNIPGGSEMQVLRVTGEDMHIKLKFAGGVTGLQTQLQNDGLLQLDSSGVLSLVGAH